MLGSSPLARGLPPPPSAGGGAPRIIPARAGFTAASWSPHGARTDHPRSRGVYPPYPRHLQPGRGSSPLARGLRGAGDPAALPRGIIPARAGFTRATPPTPCPEWDHPRSRGVYFWERVILDGLLGSSPLARGLPALVDECEREGRIIPARAGFTPRAPGPRPGVRDHPRSRGVYPLILAHPPGTAGSSPLARGLRDTGGHAATATRIIPARAGFTPRCPRRSCRRPDHPRSRGVYRRVRGRRPRRGGSSPLARGLLPQVEGHQFVLGIIPARAGFTSRRSAGRPSPGDHPRSRGVYIALVIVILHRWGSSPLARGLRLPAAAGRLGGGIIPARAGFTGGPGRPEPAHADHPRSRGVYRQRRSCGL